MFHKAEINDTICDTLITVGKNQKRKRNHASKQLGFQSVGCLLSSGFVRGFLTIIEF